MITIQKEGIGVLGSTYTDDIEMTITTGENSTVVIVTNGSVTVEGGSVPNLQTGDIWVIAGQSNCGRSRVSEMTAEQQAIYAGEFSNVTMMNQYVSKTTYDNMDAGVNTMLVNPNNSDEFGFELSFFKKINEVDSTKRYFCVKHGYGASGLAVHWQPSYDPSELFFLAMTNRLQQLSINAVQEGITPRLRGFIWMQGETDSDPNQVWAEAYFTNIVNFFNQFDNKLAAYIKTNGLSNESLDYRKVICKIKRFDGNKEDTVNQAFIDYASIPGHNCKLVETEDLTLRDSIHWDATSQITLGERIYVKMFE